MTEKRTGITDQHYDRRIVTAPDWMEDFACLAGDCPEVCCQQWNVDVDPKHAESLRHIEDPELQELMNRVLRTVRIRRPGSRQADTIHRLQLLNQPDHHCPLLNERRECRLQKKYGAYVLCDTCYFHPRTFWQIDEQTYLSACLSCPECAKLALAHEEPTRFTRFEAEIDPEAEWLETELISDPETRELMLHRDSRIASLCEILQDRRFPLSQRVLNAADHLNDPAAGPFSAPKPLDGPEFMANFIEIFDPVSETLEKPAQGTAAFMHELAGGEKGYTALLFENYRKGSIIYRKYITDRLYLEENFLIHCVFSDSFKQFFRLQNEALTVRDVLQHEQALLTAWYLFFSIQFSQAALVNGEMTEALFLQTAARTDKLYWHYPDWFARCADRLSSFPPEMIRNMIVSL